MQRLKRSEEADVKILKILKKFYYNQKHAVGDLFTVGSLVLKKDFRQKRWRGGKMDYCWQDPIVTKS